MPPCHIEQMWCAELVELMTAISNWRFVCPPSHDIVRNAASKQHWFLWCCIQPRCAKSMKLTWCRLSLGNSVSDAWIGRMRLSNSLRGIHFLHLRHGSSLVKQGRSCWFIYCYLSSTFWKGPSGHFESLAVPGVPGCRMLLVKPRRKQKWMQLWRMVRCW